MEIREVDPADERLTRRWWELANEVDHVDRPWSWYMAWESTLLTFRTPTAAWERVVLGAFEGDALVAGAHLQLPLLDNTHIGHVWPFVPVSLRRRGIGSALLRHALSLARERGRDTAIAAVMVPEGCEAPGLGFAERHGFEPGITEGTKVLDLPGTEHLWPALAAETAPHHQGYTLVTYQDRVPDDLVPGYCALNEAFNEEAPMGDLDIAPERWDRARVRDNERVFRETRRHQVATAAVASDGTVAGLTEMLVSEFSRERAVQGGTIVSPGHRGHRLGLAMKVANHRALRERFPEVVRVITGNADVNAHMNAVNERLGFREVEQCIEMQRKL